MTLFQACAGIGSDQLRLLERIVVSFAARS
jgi:hypothetical protein